MTATRETPVGLFAPGKNCWCVETATKVAVIVDADAYFRAARAAMRKARRRIMLIGWDFDARIALEHPGVGGRPESIDAFLSAAVASNRDLHVYVLRWDVGALNAFTRGSTAFTLLRWMLHPRIHLRLDGRGGGRGRAALPRPHRLGETLDLRREPVLRLAQDRHRDCPAPGGGGRSRDRRGQSGHGAGLDRAGRDGHGAGKAHGGAEAARSAPAPAHVPPRRGGRDADLRPRQDPRRGRPHPEGRLVQLQQQVAPPRHGMRRRPGRPWT